VILLPPEIVPVEGPVVFLAGPIKGAPDWQSEAARPLLAALPDVRVASPRRVYAPGTYDAAAQIDWETHFLRLAGTRGVILFWLAREVEHDPTRAYAQTTRFELAEWKVRHERDGAKLVVGIEDGFTGARYIRHRFERDCPTVPLVSSLEDACRVAAELLRG
jgi:hypothetical protein